MKAVVLSIALALAVLMLTTFLPPAGCRRKPAGDLPTIPMRIGKDTLTLEVANTNATREYGLMHRDSMPADHGMLFVFPDERRLGFWMKNTRIPLDIIFIDAAGKVVSIHQMKPHDLSTTKSDGPAKYAIELNKGRATPTGIKPGDVIEIPRDVEAK
jgi:uncharacterized protein